MKMTPESYNRASGLFPAAFPLANHSVNINFLEKLNGGEYDNDIAIVLDAIRDYDWPEINDEGEIIDYDIFTPAESDIENCKRESESVHSIRKQSGLSCVGCKNNNTKMCSKRYGDIKKWRQKIK